MNKYHTKFFSILLLALFILLVPATSLAAYDAGAHKRDYINRWVARVEKQVARMMERYCKQFTRYEERYGSNVPAFCEEEPDEPEPSPSQSPSPSPIPSPSPSPSPTPAVNIVLSEVYYDVDDLHGEETANEWVEVRNNNDVEANVSGFVVADGNSSDVFPDGTVIPANGYLLVTNNSSTTSFWTIPSGTSVVALGSLIGNGLATGGDVVYLKDASAVVVDAVSWGSSTAAFDPAVPGVAEGLSIARADSSTDTNTAGDWVALAVPTPG